MATFCNCDCVRMDSRYLIKELSENFIVKHYILIAELQVKKE